jgi:hypothetical protein
VAAGLGEKEGAALTEKVELVRPPRARIAMGTPVVAVGLTVILLVLPSAVSALLVWQGYREAIRSAELRAESAAQIVGAHVRWIGETAYQALRRVDEALGARPDLFLATTVGDLDTAVASLPAGVAVWVVDNDGDSVLTNDDGVTPSSGR